MQDIRRALAEYLDEEASWHRFQARMHPDDPRQALSAAGLRHLAEFVMSLAPDDARLARLAALHWEVEGHFLAGQRGDGVAGRYLIDVPDEPPQQWLSRFTDACVQDARADGDGHVPR